MAETNPSISIGEAVLGITDDLIPEVAVSTAWETLTGEQLSFDEIEERHAQFVVHEADPREVKREALEAHILFESLFGLLVLREKTCEDSLVSWPAYSGLMEDHGHVSGGNALMVGSYSALSSRAFDVLAHDVYGAGATYVVDITSTVAKNRQSTFVYADGLSLPFRDASMQYVHTNHLIHMLRDLSRGAETLPSRIAWFASEIARVTAPGGQVFMKEVVPGSLDYPTSEQAMEAAYEFGGFIEKLFGRLGFEFTVVTIPVLPSGVEYLFDRKRDFEAYPYYIDASSALIYARKWQ